MSLYYISLKGKCEMKIRCGVVAATASLIAGTAYAQSNVTLYGVADAGIEYLSNAPSASNGSNLVRM
ncbi:porin, partial [Mycobacterium tuberculosis]|nr:porin [Mycobacterium tuberculosis]